MRMMSARALQGSPLVTVVIPHYNYGRFLPTAVASVLSQSDVRLEVIIVDDASTDGSAAVARAIAAGDDRVTLVEHEVNRRHIATYNDGLARATGEYVVLLSADDALAPGSLGRSVALLEARPDVGLVYGYTREFEDALPEIPDARPSWTVWGGQEWIRTVCRRGRNIIQTPEAVMRRSVFEDIGGYDPDFPHSGDMLMWLQAAARANVGRVNGTVQAFYRQHGENMHSVQFGGLLDDMSEARRTFDAFFARDGARVQGAARLRERSRRALGREALIATALFEDTPDREHDIHRVARFSAQSTPGLSGMLMRRWYVGAGDAEPGSRRRRLARRTEQLRWRVRGHRLRLLGT